MKRTPENKEIAHRLEEIQNFYGKSDEYMAGLLDYNLHTYKCIKNGDQALSTKRIVLLSKDDQFSKELVYILSGYKPKVDYSVKGLEGYVESLEPKRVVLFLSDIQMVVSRSLAKWTENNITKK